jgi:hypothetical protein
MASIGRGSCARPYEGLRGRRADATGLPRVARSSGRTPRVKPRTGRRSSRQGPLVANALLDAVRSRARADGEQSARCPAAGPMRLRATHRRGLGPNCGGGLPPPSSARTSPRSGIDVAVKALPYNAWIGALEARPRLRPGGSGSAERGADHPTSSTRARWTRRSSRRSERRPSPTSTGFASEAGEPRALRRFEAELSIPPDAAAPWAASSPVIYVEAAPSLPLSRVSPLCGVFQHRRHHGFSEPFQPLMRGRRRARHWTTCRCSWASSRAELIWPTRDQIHIILDKTPWSIGTTLPLTLTVKQVNVHGDGSQISTQEASVMARVHVVAARPLLVLISFLIAGGVRFAQFTGNIQGRVEDPERRAVSRRRRCTLNHRHARRTADHHDGRGRSASGFLSLAPGAYKITGEASGVRQGGSATSTSGHEPDAERPIAVKVGTAAEKRWTSRRRLRSSTRARPGTR